MIRSDYFLRMIEEFMQALARIRALKKERRLDEASGVLDESFKQLIGERAQDVLRLSETELFARLVQAGPTQVVREKALWLTTLLNEAGDVATAKDSPEAARAFYLKALHLLLNTLAREEAFGCPEFVPKVEMLKSALQDAPLSLQTHAMLMRHYERLGEFAKAEDTLFAMFEVEPDNGSLMEFGLAFYRRLLEQGEDALLAGNLPRAEVEQSVADLQARLGALPSRKQP